MGYSIIEPNLLQEIENKGNFDVSSYYLSPGSSLSAICMKSCVSMWCQTILFPVPRFLCKT